MYNPFNINRITEVTRLLDGSFEYQLWSSDNDNKILSDREKLNLVLCNPAALRVFKLQCDLFSLAKFKAYKNDKEVENDALIDLLNYPNPFQTQRQFLWDYMFWNMLGTSYLYTSSKVINDNTNLYFLNPTCFEWTTTLCNRLDKIALSNKMYEELSKLTINYCNLDGTKTPYKLSEVMPFFDLSNGLGNWYKGNSSLDALIGVISNVNKSVHSKGVSLDFSAKYLVSGQQQPNNVSQVPMGKEEQQNIERSARSKKTVHAVKNMIDVKRFVEDMDKLKFDDSYMNDYFRIGAMYGIPRDILEASLEGSTYENQEKSAFRYVEQCLQPKGNDFADGLERLFGYTDKGIDIRIDFSHLSFMQVVKKERAEVTKLKLDNIKLALDMGAIDVNEAKEKIQNIFENE